MGPPSSETCHFIPASSGFVVAPFTMTGLLHAHSGLRFLILLLAGVNLLLLGVGLAKKSPFGRRERALGSAFAGLLHLQVVLGATMVALGRFYPALAGHIVMMLLAAVSAQVAMSKNRRLPTPGLVLPLVGVLLALMFITGGVMAIGRGLFTMTVR
jgi:hypothetical protein